MTLPESHETKSLEPVEGLRVFDPAYAGAIWKVVQTSGIYVYIQRVSDGRLYHHTRRSWRDAAEGGTLRACPPVFPQTIFHSEKPGTTPAEAPDD